MHTIILPKDNVKDFSELADFIKEGVTIHFVEHYSQVYPLLFNKNDEKNN